MGKSSLVELDRYDAFLLLKLFKAIASKSLKLEESWKIGAER